MCLRLQYFFRNRNAVEVGSVIREAYRLQESTPAEVNPKRMLEPFSPLTRGQYPIFNKYPKFVVDYQVNWELCKILREKCLFSGVKSTDPSHENSKQPIIGNTRIDGELRHQLECLKSNFRFLLKKATLLENAFLPVRCTQLFADSEVPPF